jgi:peptidoglycan hydrolase CwlO-like protein
MCIGLPTHLPLPLWCRRSPGDDLSGLDDEMFKAMVDSHNRIVALMSNNNPANIVDSLAMRRAGKGFGTAEGAAKAKEEHEAELASLAAAEAKAAAEATAAAEAKAAAAGGGGADSNHSEGGTPGAKAPSVELA